jgi:hypothetical protein
MRKILPPETHYLLAIIALACSRIQRAKSEASLHPDRGSESLDKVIWIAVIVTAATGAAAVLAAAVSDRLSGIR